MFCLRDCLAVQCIKALPGRAFVSGDVTERSRALWRLNTRDIWTPRRRLYQAVPRHCHLVAHTNCVGGCTLLVRLQLSGRPIVAISHVNHHLLAQDKSWHCVFYATLTYRFVTTLLPSRRHGNVIIHKVPSFGISPIVKGQGFLSDDINRTAVYHHDSANSYQFPVSVPIEMIPRPVPASTPCAVKT